MYLKNRYPQGNRSAKISLTPLYGQIKEHEVLWEIFDAAATAAAAATGL
jgi:hypothetical protein